MQFILIVYLHLLMPTFEAPANHGSNMKMHLKVLASTRPSRKLGLSCSLNPLRNQWTECLFFILKSILSGYRGRNTQMHFFGTPGSTWFGHLLTKSKTTTCRERVFSTGRL